MHFWGWKPPGLKEFKENTADAFWEMKCFQPPMKCL